MSKTICREELCNCAQVVPRGGQAVELRPVLDDVHVQVAVRAPHPHALLQLLLRVQRLRPDLRQGQLSHTASQPRAPREPQQRVGEQHWQHQQRRHQHQQRQLRLAWCLRLKFCAHGQPLHDISRNAGVNARRAEQNVGNVSAVNSFHVVTASPPHAHAAANVWPDASNGLINGIAVG